MNRWYLYRLFQSNKLLFWSVIVFIFFQIYFNQKRIHSFPWFVWDMYSRPLPIKKDNSLFVLVLDGKTYNHTQLPNWKEETIIKTNKLYKRLIESNHHDPIANAVNSRTKYVGKNIKKYAQKQLLNQKNDYALNYENWLYQYVQRNVAIKFNQLELKEIKLKWQNNQYLLVDTLTHFKIQNE